MHDLGIRGYKDEIMILFDQQVTASVLHHKRDCLNFRLIKILIQDVDHGEKLSLSEFVHLYNEVLQCERSNFCFVNLSHMT